MVGRGIPRQSCAEPGRDAVRAPGGENLALDVPVGARIGSVHDNQRRMSPLTVVNRPKNGLVRD